VPQPSHNLRMRIDELIRADIDRFAHDERRSKKSIVELAVQQYAPGGLTAFLPPDRLAWVEQRAKAKNVSPGEYLANVVEWAMRQSEKR